MKSLSVTWTLLSELPPVQSEFKEKNKIKSLLVAMVTRQIFLKLLRILRGHANHYSCKVSRFYDVQQNFYSEKPPWNYFDESKLISLFIGWSRNEVFLQIAVSCTLSFHHYKHVLHSRKNFHSVYFIINKIKHTERVHSHTILPNVIVTARI